MRLLLVEDDIPLQRLTAKGLRQAGLAVDVAGDGEEALCKLDEVAYEVIVLDRDLPRVHGDDVCRAVVGRDPQPRVLMLTAFGEIEDRVNGLGIGADDYLAKPFAMSELVARVHALARRPATAIAPILRHADLHVDLGARAVTRGDRSVDLTPKEFGVLVALLTAAPAVVSAEELLDRVWDENADPFTNAVRVTMANLRRKLGPPDLIVTKVGAGYCVGC